MIAFVGRRQCTELTDVSVESTNLASHIWSLADRGSNGMACLLHWPFDFWVCLVLCVQINELLQ